MPVKAVSFISIVALVAINPLQAACFLENRVDAILGICADNDIRYAIKFERKTGSFYYGQWRNGPVGYGFFGNRVFENGHAYCGGWRYEYYYDGREVHDISEFLDSIDSQGIGCRGSLCPDGFRVEYHEVSNLQIGHFVQGGPEGFSVSTELGSYFIGYRHSHGLNGEGIELNLIEKTFTHAVWKDGRVVKTIKTVNISDHLKMPAQCEQ